MYSGYLMRVKRLSESINAADLSCEKVLRFLIRTGPNEASIEPLINNKQSLFIIIKKKTLIKVLENTN